MLLERGLDFFMAGGKKCGKNILSAEIKKGQNNCGSWLPVNNY